MASRQPDETGEVADRIPAESKVNLTTPRSRGGDADQGPVRRDRVTVSAAEIEEREVQWLWPGRIAVGEVNLIAGAGEIGTTFLCIDIAARASRGRSYFDAGDVENPIGSVLYICDPDHLADLIKPRLRRADADLARVHFLDDQEFAAFARGDLAVPRRAVAEIEDLRLLVVDTPTALGGDGVRRNPALQGLIPSLGALARARGIAVVVVAPTARAPTRREANRAVAAAGCRIAWLVVEDPSDPACRLMLSIKNSLSTAVGGLAFRLAEQDDGAVVEWLDRTDINAQAVPTGRRERPGGRIPNADRAAAWLRQFLADGPRPAEDCTREGNAALGLGHDRKWWRDRVLKGTLEGQPRKGRGTLVGPWYWGLPGQATPGDGESADEESEGSEDGKEAKGHGTGLELVPSPPTLEPAESALVFPTGAGTEEDANAAVDSSPSSPSSVTGDEATFLPLDSSPSSPSSPSSDSSGSGEGGYGLVPEVGSMVREATLGPESITDEEAAALREWLLESFSPRKGMKLERIRERAQRDGRDVAKVEYLIRERKAMWHDGQGFWHLPED
jgi:hypothetical protein